MMNLCELSEKYLLPNWGFGHTISAHPDKSAIFFPMNVLGRVTCLDIDRLWEKLAADEWFRGAVRLDGHVYASTWGYGKFENPLNEDFPRAGYLIEDHWDNEPYGRRIDLTDRGFEYAAPSGGRAQKFMLKQSETAEQLVPDDSSSRKFKVKWVKITP